MRSVGVMIVVVSVSSVARPVVVPAGVVLFSALPVGSAVLLSQLVVDVLAVVVLWVTLRSAGVVSVVVPV